MHTLAALLPLIVVLGVIYVIVALAVSVHKVKDNTIDKEIGKEEKEDKADKKDKQEKGEE